jgi:glycosyltransferase involved in cell wall biosynthesis
VEFTGYLAGKELLASLSTFDIGVIPDPKDCYTDHITMNKAFEYMFLGKPVVGFRLRETERIVGDCGVFAEQETPEALADAIARLLDDAGLRTRLGEAARKRAREEFSWTADAQKLVGAYANLLRARPAVRTWSLGRILRWRPGQPPSAT